MHYALFLRVTPIFPAWFINVASPIVDIPFSVFIIATAVGHQPHNLITIQARASGGNRTLMRGEDAPCVHYKVGPPLRWADRSVSDGSVAPVIDVRTLVFHI